MKINQNKTTTSRTEFFYYAFRNILLVSLPLIIISIFLLSLPHSSADNSSADNLVLSVPSSCTLNATINSEHSTSAIGGTYIEDIGTTTLKTICNDANGFSIYAIGSSSSTEGNTKLVSSVSSDYDIATGTATYGNISNWAMKLTPVSGAYTPNMAEGYNGQYVSVPGTWTKVAYRPSNTDISTNSSVAGSSLTTTYAAYINSAQPAGTYTGQVKYVLLHPNTNQNFMTLEMALDHYVGPEHKITLDGSATGPKYYRMQDMTNQICQAATVMGDGGQLQLIDDRINLDGNKRLYWVAKLDDGNCWMTQNLDLDLIANRAYTHADTDLGWSPNSFDVNATWTLTGGPSTIIFDSLTNSFPGWQDSYALPYSAGYTSVSTSHTASGNYYNWPASVASNNASSLGKAPNSICPAKWRLPNFYINEFGNLLITYKVVKSIYDKSYADNGYTIIRNAPLYFTVGGSIDRGKNIGGGGSYWTDSSEYQYARFMSYNSSSITLSPNNARGTQGRSVRCLAR